MTQSSHACFPPIGTPKNVCPSAARALVALARRANHVIECARRRAAAGVAELVDALELGSSDASCGAIEGCPFYVGASQFKYWASFQITVDVTAGGGDSFSIEAPEGVRFIVRSCPFTDAEAAELDAERPPPAGASAPDAAA